MSSPTLWVRNGFFFDPAVGVPRPGGVLVRAGRIVATGTDRSVARDFPGGAARVLDMEGGLLTPGLHDAHGHFSEGGLSLLQVDCRDARSHDDLADRARREAESLGPQHFVTGRGWDERAHPGGAPPTRVALDRACPENPVLLMRVCGHVAVANGAALSLAAITRETPDPVGGRIGRDGAGEPDGQLVETAIALVRSCVPPPSRMARLEGLRRSFELARRSGLTSLQDELGWPELLEELRESGEATCRVRLWNRLERPLEELLTWRAEFPCSDRLQPGMLKGYVDG
ncbi:amidohydrolase, partial [Planctomycetota bacterium]